MCQSWVTLRPEFWQTTVPLPSQIRLITTQLYLRPFGHFVGTVYHEIQTHERLKKQKQKQKTFIYYYTDTRCAKCEPFMCVHLVLERWQSFLFHILVYPEF